MVMPGGWCKMEKSATRPDQVGSTWSSRISASLQCDSRLLLLLVFGTLPMMQLMTLWLHCNRTRKPCMHCIDQQGCTGPGMHCPWRQHLQRVSHSQLGIFFHQLRPHSPALGSEWRHFVQQPPPTKRLGQKRADPLLQPDRRGKQSKTTYARECIRLFSSTTF